MLNIIYYSIVKIFQICFWGSSISTYKVSINSLSFKEKSNKTGSIQTLTAIFF